MHAIHYTSISSTLRQADILPILKALAAQAFSYLLLSLLISQTGWQTSVTQLAWLQGVLASLPFVRRERWWIPIQVFFPPLAVFILSRQVDANWFLLCFLLLGFVYWNAYRTRVPLYLTGRAVEAEILKRLPDGHFAFADMGSGLGGLLSRLAKTKPDGKFCGVEIAPLPFLVGWARCANLRNCKMAWGQYEHVDLSTFDFVYAYLSPVPMPALYDKAKQEMKQGSMFISNSFDVPGVSPDEVLEAGGKVLYLWRF